MGLKEIDRKLDTCSDDKKTERRSSREIRDNLRIGDRKKRQWKHRKFRRYTFFNCAYYAGFAACCKALHSFFSRKKQFVVCR